jgi:hypothetical protein
MTRLTQGKRPLTSSPGRSGLRTAFGLIFPALLLATAATADIEVSKVNAKWMHDRLVGIPPSAPVLNEMAQAIENANARGAADIAMRNPAFYNSALRDFVTPWTNEEQTVYADLNDFTATVIGMIRDDEPFNEVLSGDIIYVGAPGVVPDDYSHTDNAHYVQLQDRLIDLSDDTLLVKQQQSTLPGSQITAEEAAGVITTRAAGMAFFRAGTNRRMIRYTAMNFLCRDMEDLWDDTRPADRIRQDVPRSPGGDSEIFFSTCIGCHTGMDPMSQALAYFDWDAEQERVVHTRGEVQEKYLINSSTFPYGYVTPDNRWDNFWRTGPRSTLGWRGPSSGGYGAKTMGAEIAGSRAFSLCKVEQVFEQVCFRPPGNPADRQAVSDIAEIFEQDYSMQEVFAQTAMYCMENP